MQLSHCRLVVPTLDQAVGVSEDIVDLGVDVVDRVGPAVDVVVGKADRTVDMVVGRAEKVSVEVVGRAVREGWDGNNGGEVKLNLVVGIAESEVDQVASVV